MKEIEGFVRTDDGVRLYYQMLGEGSPVVIVPGAVFLKSELLAIAERRTLLFYDSRCRGRSDAVAVSKLGIEHVLFDLDAVRREFGLGRVSILGWSYNGLVAAIYATRHPERVERLVLVGPIPPRRDPYRLPESEYAEGARAKGDARVDPNAVKQLERMRAENLEARDPVTYYRMEHEISTQRLAAEREALGKLHYDSTACPNEWPPNVARYWEKLYDSLGDWDLRPDLVRLRAPMLLVAGDSDIVLPLEAAHEWVSSAPNAREVILSGVGHFPWVERPDEFLATVDPFLPAHNDSVR